ncbi:MAG: tail fiber domain-containing protein [Bacteroidota bacterium]
MKNTKNIMRFGLMLLLLIIIFQDSSAQSWSLSGNAATDPNTMFIGTTDLKALRFRTNNQVRLAISNAGKIGVGTQTPVFKFDLRGGSYNTDSSYRINGISVISRDNSNRIQLGDASALVGIGTSTPTTTLQVAGTATATDFVGGGSGITSINASNLTSGTVSDSRLSSNVALISAANTFTGSNSFDQDLIVNGLRIGKGGGNNAFNTAVGLGALNSNTTGYENTASGFLALYSNTTGYENTANGSSALFYNTTGGSNTASGYRALFSNTTGGSNTAHGYYALYSNSNGEGNTGIGIYALLNDTNANYNTALGNSAGYYRTNGDNNTFLGGYCYATIDGLTNTSSLGYSTVVDASNKVRIGNSAITSIGGQVGWTTFSDGRYKKNVEEDVPGLDFISKLRPVTYTTDITGLDNHYPKPTPREGQELPTLGDVSEQEKIRYSGFIAQEVEAAAKEIGYDFSGVDKPQKEGNLYGIRYAEFVVPMVKAIQEQQEIIKKQQKQIDELKATLETRSNSGAINLGVN